MAGKKDALTDKKNKPRLSLIPKEALFELGHALTYGEEKYGTHNYKEGIKLSYLLDAAMRHINQFNDGEDLDSESGNLHLGHAMANLAMAVDTFYNRKSFDDRYKEESKTVYVHVKDDHSWTCTQSDMYFLEKGTVVKRKDSGEDLRVVTDGTFAVKAGDIVFEPKNDGVTSESKV